MTTPGSVAVVGASVGSSALVSELRTSGFAGRITVVDADPDAPYDRPPLSKQFLLAADEIKPEARWWDDRCELVRVSARHLDVAAKSIQTVTDTGDDVTVTADHIVIATGSTPIRLPGQPHGVAELRTAADARNIRQATTPGSRVVILGAGTIGTELASSLVERSCAVTVIDKAGRPLDRFLGGHLGDETRAWIVDGGVELLLDTSVERTARQDDSRWTVSTTAGAITADIVVSAVGTRPATAWLNDSGLDVGNGVRCDANGSAMTVAGDTVPHIHALGDVARWAASAGRPARRYEDWTTAQRQGRHLAESLLGRVPAEPFDAEPHYFWSHQFGRRIQVLGTPSRDGALVHHADAPGRGSFYTVETEGGRTACIAVNSPAAFAMAVKESASLAR